MKITSNLLVITGLVFTYFALPPQARAGCQEGCGSGNGNTFLGEDVLLNNTGLNNTAVGWNAMLGHPVGGSGGDNTAVGFNALFDVIDGSYNTAIGDGSQYNNQIGNYNTATGYSSIHGTDSSFQPTWEQQHC